MRSFLHPAQRVGTDTHGSSQDTPRPLPRVEASRPGIRQATLTFCFFAARRRGDFMSFLAWSSAIFKATARWGAIPCVRREFCTTRKNSSVLTSRTAIHRTPGPSRQQSLSREGSSISPGTTTSHDTMTRRTAKPRTETALPPPGKAPLHLQAPQLR